MALNEPPSGRTSSPVHVVQRTWESRNRDVQAQTPERDYRSTSPRSRSVSPKSPINGHEEKKSDSSRAKSKSSFAINSSSNKNTLLINL